ncbi:hypothetical protein [uncultured Sphingomonas sp.]|uniref:hypothetical protein n=1 Tax=uncultured Sphingomonas sp. TaxID=158754 RepID=UPI0025897042|nr:hypothetical protein [uncultured Sphingomonas sp.]
MAVLLAQGWTRPVVFTQPPPSISPEQLTLFPRTSVLELPRTDGEDIYQFVLADNDRKYYLKLDRDNRYVRASEWLSYRIANLIGVTTPRCDFIQTFNGDVAFGSEDVAGVSSKAETARYLQTPSRNEFGMVIPGLCRSLTAIHVLDLFLNNIDRHYSNFLVVGRGEERQLLAMDFARSLFWDWPLNSFPKPSDQTSEVWVELRQRHGFDEETARMVTARLGAITAHELTAVLEQIPLHWLPPALRADFHTYCRNGGWNARVAELRRGLEDGTIV